MAKVKECKVTEDMGLFSGKVCDCVKEEQLKCLKDLKRAKKIKKAKKKLNKAFVAFVEAMGQSEGI